MVVATLRKVRVVRGEASRLSQLDPLPHQIT
jgi:hypothetical protein